MGRSQQGTREDGMEDCPDSKPHGEISGCIFTARRDPRLQQPVDMYAGACGHDDHGHELGASTISPGGINLFPFLFFSFSSDSCLFPLLFFLSLFSFPLLVPLHLFSGSPIALV